MSEHLPRKVRAILACYVEHVYRKTGEEFLYEGPPNPRVFQENPEVTEAIPQSKFAESSEPGMVAAHAPERPADQIQAVQPSKVKPPMALKPPMKLKPPLAEPSILD